MTLGQRLPDEREIRVSFGAIPIDSALLLLSKASGVNISYNPDILPRYERRALAVERVKLGLALDDVLYDTGLAYKIIGNQLIIVKVPVVSDRRYTISGYIYDSDSEERLIYASLISGDSRYTAITDEYGYYSISVPEGQHYFHSHYLGYPTTLMELTLRRDTVINIGMKADNTLNEVLIVEKMPKVSQDAVQRVDIPIELMNGMPALGGEPDLFRMIHMKAGITSGADGLGGLNVRGGTADQNLILLDGVPLYNTGHALGLFSVFNPSVIKSAQLIRSGIPSRYGGRLSSVLDVRVKEGNKKRIKGDVAVSPLLIRGVLEGPIQKGLSSYIVSARRTIADPWLRPLSSYQLRQNNSLGYLNYYFYDLNAKVNFVLGSKDELYLSAYSGRDRFDNDVLSTLKNPLDESATQNLDVSAWDWGNTTTSLRWGHYFSPRWVSHVHVGYTDYRFESFDFNRTRIRYGQPTESLIYDISYNKSEIRDLMLTADVDFYASDWYEMTLGAQYISHTISPAVTYRTTQSDILDSDDRISISDMRGRAYDQTNTGVELRGYIENRLSLGPLRMNLGIHYNQTSTQETHYRYWEPRFSVDWSLARGLSVHGGYSEMDQYLHLLTSSGYGLPNDVWIPSTDRISPQRSSEYSLGLKGRVSDKWTWGLSAYQRQYDDIRGLVQGGLLAIQNSDWDQDIPVGSGRAQGLELEMEKRAGRLKGGLNYTYAHSFRQFDEINGGVEYEAQNDRRHSVKINGLWQVNTNVEISLGWQMSSGLPYTSPVGLNIVNVDNNPIYLPIYDGINNVRLKTYHRLDFGINLYTKYHWGRQKFSIGAYNAYNRQNPFYIDILIDETTQRFDRFESVSLVPMIPYVGFALSF